jgi:hypothetical protein
MHCHQPHVVCLFKSRIGRQAENLGSTEVARVIHVSLFAGRLQFAWRSIGGSPRFAFRPADRTRSSKSFVLRMHPRFSQIDGKLRRGLVKIRTAIQMASANSNSGDETRCREEDNKANSGVCCALSLSAVAELRARGVRH